MIIVGAGGHSKEILQIISVDYDKPDNSIVFFDNVNSNVPDTLFDRFKILKSCNQLSEYLLKNEDKFFILGLGTPKNREMLYNKFVKLGAVPKSICSKKAEIGSFEVRVGDGTAILAGAIVSNAVSIGKGVLIYYNTVIAHDCVIGNFTEIAPGVNISGRCKIGNNCKIGANATILPDVVLGDNVTIGAGTVVLKNVPSNSVVVGVPGKIIK